MHETSFTFQANPRIIEQQPKYRNETSKNNGACLISVDPRVYKGSTYSKNKQVKEEPIKPKTIKKTLPVSNRSLTTNIDSQMMNSAPQKDNRIDLEIQTEPYLQEIVEKPIIVTIETQTDEFLDRPETPPYIPPKNGIDKEIQVIEEDLFDFDFEVQPIVSTIIGKTLEQSFLEVHEEEELLAIRRHKDAIEHQRNVELADIQRLEEAERRKFEEKQKRIEEKEKLEKEQNELRQKIATRGFAEFFSADILNDAINLLDKNGFFYDEIEKEVKVSFIPWLESSIKEASHTQKLNLSIIENIEYSALNYINNIHEESQNLLDNKEMLNANIRNQIMRKMINEDIVGLAIRKSNLIKNKNKPKIDNDNDDDDN